MKGKLLIVLFFPIGLFSQVSGTWHTSFVVMGMSKRLDLSLEINAKDTSGWIRDPETKATTKISLDRIFFHNDSLHFSWSAGRLTFDGEYFVTGDSLNGIFHQAGLKWDARFTREQQKPITLNRPQEPLAPFPYKSEEVLIKNGDVTLAATLTLPEKETNFPVVVLASGSGPQDRNCTIMGHKPFFVIADYLARQGIACLRFDDRGTGKSSGVFMQATLEDFASDVKACVNYLKMDRRFISSPVGIAGHSEGGMHALMAAKKNKEVAFVIELASVGTSGLEVFLTQQYVIPLKQSGDTSLAHWNSEFFRGACAIINAVHDPETRTKKLNDYLDACYMSAPEEIRNNQPIMSFKLAVQMLINTEWFRQFQSFVADDYLKKLAIPILAINGSADVQVEPISNSQGFMDGFSKRSQQHSKAVIMPGLNHLMQHCTSCTVTEYGDLEESFASEVMEIMVEWLRSKSFY